MMLAYYRYKLSKGMMMLEQVPEPYRSQLTSEIEPKAPEEAE